MSARELLIELHRRGIAVVMADNLLRLRGPKGAIPPELRAAVTAERDGILELLQRRRAVGEAFSAAWSRIGAALRGVSGNVDEQLAACAPALGDQIRTAERTVDEEALRYQAGDADGTRFGDALRRWEALWRDAGEVLGG